ncbi:uncharacterized GPI-anchored protein At3g06035-like [Corylus avellana]|uniref:uncharacterized GPI-anchored protein At3g06035-like n=1 Tax=Corylus avellana TaxID=13451 RepID=UPI00286D5B16|nr:uncharacterized GPI-anchored protein At3g06035-like [Corylus avellana]
MAFTKLGLVLFFIVLHSMMFLSYAMHCDVQSQSEEEEKLLQNMNGYRQALSLALFGENSKAACLADEIADELKDKPCDKNAHGYSSFPGTKPKFDDFENLLDKCDINVNTTEYGAILVSCGPRIDSPLVLDTYTKSEYAKYINNSNYTTAAVGSKDDWVVVILSSNSSDGTFSGAVSLVPNIISMANSIVALFFCLLLFSIL